MNDWLLPAILGGALAMGSIRLWKSGLWRVGLLLVLVCLVLFLVFWPINFRIRNKPLPDAPETSAWASDVPTAKG